MPEMLTLLVTAQLGGDLDFMARLATWLERLTRSWPQALLLDLGGACTPTIWHCAATEGRSGLVMLDGMGYHAAHVSGTLSDDSRHRLAGITTMALVDSQHSWRLHTPFQQDEGVIVSSVPTPALTLNIVLTAAEQIALEGSTLFLQAPPAPHQVWRVQVALLPAPRLLTTELHTLPAGIPAHPTLSAAAEFILDEAREAQRRQNN